MEQLKSQFPVLQKYILELEIKSRVTYIFRNSFALKSLCVSTHQLDRIIYTFIITLKPLLFLPIPLVKRSTFVFVLFYKIQLRVWICHIFDALNYRCGRNGNGRVSVTWGAGGCGSREVVSRDHSPYLSPSLLPQIPTQSQSCGHMTDPWTKIINRKTHPRILGPAVRWVMNNINELNHTTNRFAGWLWVARRGDTNDIIQHTPLTLFTNHCGFAQISWWITVANLASVRIHGIPMFTEYLTKSLVRTVRIFWDTSRPIAPKGLRTITLSFRVLGTMTFKMLQ